jgi:hypothetical protein
MWSYDTVVDSHSGRVFKLEASVYDSHQLKTFFNFQVDAAAGFKGIVEGDSQGHIPQ